MKTDIFFPVRKVENPSIAHGFDVVEDKKYAIVGEIDDKETILHYCSDRYSLMPNQAIYSELERLFSLNPNTRDFEARTYNTDNVLFYREYTFPKYKSFVGNKTDGVLAGMGVGNSYNGVRKFNGSMNAYRMICSNGLWGVTSIMKIKNKHTEIVQTAVQELFVQAMDAIEKFENQVERFNVLASATHASTNWEDRLEEVANNAGIVKYHDDAKAIVRDEADKLYGGVVNDWLIYNALNQITFSDTHNKKSVEVRQKIDERVFANMVATV